MIEDPLGINFGLRRAQQQAGRNPPHLRQSVGNTVIQRGIKQAACSIFRPVDGNRRLRVPNAAQEFRERLAQRRTYRPPQTVGCRDGRPHFLQGMLDGGDDPGGRIGQRAVQINKNAVHAPSLPSDPVPHQ